MHIRCTGGRIDHLSELSVSISGIITKASIEACFMVAIAVIKARISHAYSDDKRNIKDMN